VYIEWRDDLATGHADIDGQHKELFSRFNKLLQACHEGKGHEEVGRLLIFLGEYVRTHFDAEERLQREHRYPGYAAHRREHDEFIVRLRSLEDEFAGNEGGVALVIRTNQMISNWLNRHICGTDREMANYLHTVSGAS